MHNFTKRVTWVSRSKLHLYKESVLGVPSTPPIIEYTQRVKQSALGELQLYSESVLDVPARHRSQRTYKYFVEGTGCRSLENLASKKLPRSAHGIRSTVT